MPSVVIIGPAYPLRGGLATFNQRLAKAFEEEGWDATLLSFSLQYPSMLFPGKTQFSTESPPKDLKILSKINSINPLNWVQVGRFLQTKKPDLVVVRFWIPFMGPALGTILRLVKKNRHTRIICIADNVIPHEKRKGDKVFTSYFLKACHGFLTMSEKVLKDLRLFEKSKPAILVQHPLYDNFGERIPQDIAREKLQLSKGEKIILFFGFIRKYKGLDLLLDAMSDSRIKEQNIKLLIAGEFYEDEQPYLQKIQQKELQDSLYLHTHFIADSDVKYYLSAADAVIQPYRAATQSGVTPLAYYFEKPMVVTNVGGLPDLVPHQKSGLVCEPQPTAIADAILQLYENGIESFIPHLRVEKQKYSWPVLVNTITDLAKKTS
jgi:glycosyltransferase involved in cell wall biosynthesis